MYGFIYLTTNNVNGMRYIGQRKIHDQKSDSEYMGSGVVIGRSIKKYGLENFSKVILEECETREELDACEIKWIEKYNAVEDKGFYNIAKGGNSGDTWTGRSYYQKLKFKHRISESNRTRVRDGSKIKGENNPAFGRHWYKDVTTRKVYYLFECDSLIEELHLIRGTFRSKRHNQKISEATKGKPKTYEVGAKGKIVVNNGSHEIYIEPSNLKEFDDKGYHKGGLSRSTKNKVHMNDGSKNYYISKNKVKFYLDKGYKMNWIVSKKESEVCV